MHIHSIPNYISLMVTWTKQLIGNFKENIRVDQLFYFTNKKVNL